MDRYGKRMPAADGHLRLAGVGYLNARPALHGLLTEPTERYAVDLARPAEVARRLFEEEADAALVPVATIAQHGGLEVVPGVAIGADGPVRSVVIVGDRPLEDVDELLLDASSRTSVVLARLVADRVRRGRSLRLCTRPPERIAVEAGGAVAGLLIGDDALVARGRFACELDLAEFWKDWTGLPFVFAVWGARRGALSAEDVDALQRSLAAGLAARAEIAAAWAGAHGGDAAALLRYLTENVRYALGEREQAGLREFLARGAAAGLLPRAEVRLCVAVPEALAARDAAVGLECRAAPATPTVDALLDHAASGGRLSFDDALRLAREAPTHDLGLAADARRAAMHPEGVVTYIVDRNVNYTNACTIACRFCAFYRPVGHDEVYVLSRDELRRKIQEVVDAGGVQVLLQGGINPELRIEWYEDLFRWWKSEFPGVALHALSPEEIWAIARMEDLTLEQVLLRLRAAGMDSVPGGGAEVLTDRVRRKIARAKCTSAEWLECMRVAHRLGMRSTATMMYGTADTMVDRLAHLFKVRDLQDETGGFTAFICWDYQHEHGVKQVAGETGTVLYLRMQALSRLVLDNVPNVQSSWVTQGPGVGQLGLRFGANDMGSTMFEENVVSSAGTTFAMDAAQIERHARAAGFKVTRRNMRYEWLGTPA
jgi:cyclic dehypoxanthinyl futalosine synthase